MEGWYQPFPPYYLYFFYFLFFPISSIPLGVAVYIWDILRFLLVSYVFWKIPKVFKNKIDIFLFYSMSTLSYFFDAYYNNINFLILLLLFLSYLYFEKNKKWISGILFALATVKINSILFLPALLIVRKIKMKDIIYYIIPFFLLFLPYIIFPNYLFQMLDNWSYSSFKVPFVSSIFLELFLKGFSFIWRAVQVSQFMFIGFLYLIFLENIKRAKTKKILRVIIIVALIIFNICIAIVNILSMLSI
ncbi:MAG: glycosyltransferase 87 family protein [Candidatus Lokiarchaeota archaeon]